MSNRARVYANNQFAGVLEKVDTGYVFSYNDEYFLDKNSKSISLTLPKTKKEYYSPHLFSFFQGLLAEGITKEIQCRQLKIDENDHFSRLIKTTHGEVIGNITLIEET